MTAEMALVSELWALESLEGIGNDSDECECAYIETLPCWCDSGPVSARGCPYHSAVCRACERAAMEREVIPFPDDEDEEDEDVGF